MFAGNILKTVDVDAKLRRLACELVRNIRDAPDILNDFDISPAEYTKLARQGSFQKMLRDAEAEWKGAANTGERVRVKSANLIEQALGPLFDELVGQREPLSSRVQLLTQLSRLAGLGQQTAASGSNGGNIFRLEINLATPRGETAKTITIESKALDTSPEPDPNYELTAGIENYTNE